MQGGKEDNPSVEVSARELEVVVCGGIKRFAYQRKKVGIKS